jgi:hypothetical protein
VFYYFELISVSFSKTALSVVPGEGRQCSVKLINKTNKKQTNKRLFFQTAAPKFVAHSAQQDFSIESRENKRQLAMDDPATTGSTKPALCI